VRVTTTDSVLAHYRAGSLIQEAWRPNGDENVKQQTKDTIVALNL